MTPHPPPDSTSRPPRLADSPWFWIALFSLMGFVALSAVARKYDARQTQIEGKYLASRPDLIQPAVNQGTESPDWPRRPAQTIIPLWPIRALLFALLILSCVALLFNKRSRPSSVAGGIHKAAKPQPNRSAEE